MTNRLGRALRPRRTGHHHPYTSPALQLFHTTDRRQPPISPRSAPLYQYSITTLRHFLYFIPCSISTSIRISIVQRFSMAFLTAYPFLQRRVSLHQYGRKDWEKLDQSIDMAFWAASSRGYPYRLRQTSQSHLGYWIGIPEPPPLQ